MEYLLVTFSRSRRVKVDDEYNGRTGDVTEREAGSHVICDKEDPGGETLGRGRL